MKLELRLRVNTVEYNAVHRYNEIEHQLMNNGLL